MDVTLSGIADDPAFCGQSSLCLHPCCAARLAQSKKNKGGIFFQTEPNVQYGHHPLGHWDGWGGNSCKVLWLGYQPGHMELIQNPFWYVSYKNDTWQSTIMTLWGSEKIFQFCWLETFQTPFTGSLYYHKAQKCCIKLFSKNTLYSAVNSSAVVQGYRNILRYYIETFG